MRFRGIETVDWSQPINWDWGPNRGLKNWWLAVPNAMGFGSKTWRDLRFANHGTLTNMDAATDWRGPQSAKRGFASVDFVGSSTQLCDFGQVSALDSVTEFTMIGCGSKTAGSSSWCMGTGASGTVRSEILWFSDDNVYVSVNAIYRTYTGLSGQSGKPFHFAFVFRGNASYTLYINGVEVSISGTGSIPTVTSSAAAQGSFWLGRCANNRYTTGWHESARIYSRALSGTEIAEIHRDALDGYPNSLNRVLLSRDYSSVAASGFNPVWSAYHNVLLNAGLSS